MHRAKLGQHLHEKQENQKNALLLHYLIKNYEWDNVDNVITQHPSIVKCMLPNTNTPLHELCSIGSAPAPLVKRVLQCWTGSTTTKNRYGETPLHIKCRNSQYSSYIVTQLISISSSPCNSSNGKPPYNKSLEMENNEGQTPLGIACRSGARFTVIRELVRAYPEALLTMDVHGHTPLDLLWSTFAKTIPGASAISRYIAKKGSYKGGAEPEGGSLSREEMGGLLGRFHEKMSLCLNYSYALSRIGAGSNPVLVAEAAERDINGGNSHEGGNFSNLLCHAIIEQNLKHCPHTLLAIFLTREHTLGCQRDSNGNTPLHLLLTKDEKVSNYGYSYGKNISTLLDTCGQSASIPNGEAMLPLHIALEQLRLKRKNKGGDGNNGGDNNNSIQRLSTEIIRKIAEAYPEAVETRNPKTLFYPFMSAAVANDLSLSYEFLLQSPNVILNFIH